jgi:hypothetical protein
MTANSPPSINPADTGTMQGLFRHVLNKYMQDVDDMLPAQVIGYNNDRNNPRVNVQIMYLVTTTDGSTVPMSQLASVPVMSVSGGGFVLSFPIKNGDMGWIKANDQDLSLFFGSLQASPGNTQRMHTFEDAVFIPDLMRGWDIKEEDKDSVVLQSLDGSVKLVLSPGSDPEVKDYSIKMQVKIDPVDEEDPVDCFIKIDKTGIESKGDWRHEGDLTVHGHITET